MQESELIPKLKTGDRKAFRVLVDQYRARVFNTCLGFLHNRADAEDAAQDVFVQVYQSIDSFEGNSSLSTWIYRISVNTCLQRIRWRGRSKRSAFFRALGSGQRDPDTVAAPAYDHPEMGLEQRERAGILMAAIARLPEPQRVAFTLHKVEGLSYREVAAVMEKSLSAVESLMHRAGKRLREDLSDYYASDRS